MVFSKFNENNKFSLIWVFRSIVPKSSMWIIVITLCPSLSSGASICFLHSHILHWNHWTIWKQSSCWWEIYGAKYCRTYLIQDPSQKPQTWLTLNYSWMSEWLLFNAKWAIFQLYHGENKLLVHSMIMMYTLYYTIRLDSIVLANWNNSPDS